MASAPPEAQLKVIPEPVSSRTRELFAKYPWCTTLLNDPKYIPVQTYHHTSRADVPNNFLTVTLNTPDTIIASHTFHFQSSPPQSQTKRRNSPSASLGAVDQLITLYVLGSGVNGWEGFAHGGFIASLLDMQAGCLVVYHPMVKSPRTKSLHVEYFRAVPVPGAIMVRAWRVKAEGRKSWVVAEAVDGDGGVLVRADIVFVDAAARL